jgi:hypothetical protein
LISNTFESLIKIYSLYIPSRQTDLFHQKLGAADLIAKIMMAAAVNQPNVGETLISTYKPPIKIGGS